MRSRLLALAAAVAFVAGAVPARADDTSMIDASYDSARAFYDAYDGLFLTYWRRETGKDPVIYQSRGPSAAQARAVIGGGLKADVVTLASGADVDTIAQQSALLPASWAGDFSEHAAPYTTTIVFLVRRGNPKRLRDWSDLAKPGVSVVTASPKTSDAGRWSFLAAYRAGLRANGGDDARAAAYAAAIYKNVSELDATDLGAETAFADRGTGDVLIDWENDAILRARERPSAFEVVTPPSSVLAEPAVAVVLANARRHYTEALARAYLQYLYADPAQNLVCELGFRPRTASSLRSCRTTFGATDLAPISAFGGWAAAQQRFFADGGVFDRATSAAR